MTTQRFPTETNQDDSKISSNDSQDEGRESIFSMESANLTSTDADDKPKLKKFLKSRQTELAKVLLVITGLFLCLWFEMVVTWVIRDTMFTVWVTSALLLNAIFFADMCAHFYAYGFHQALFLRKSLLLEIIFTLGLLAALFWLFAAGFDKSVQACNFLAVIFIGRGSRLLLYLTELESFAIIGKTFLHFSQPFLNMLFTLYTIFYIFSMLGMLLWSGNVNFNVIQKYNNEIPTLYYLMNFNDLGSAMVTLFQQMIINNWYVTCNMICLI